MGDSGRPRQQEHHTLSYTNEKRIPRFFLFVVYPSTLVLSSIQNDLFRSCMDDESTCRKMFNYFSQFPNRSHQFNSRIVDTHFASQRASINRETVALLRVRNKSNACGMCTLLLFLIVGKVCTGVFSALWCGFALSHAHMISVERPALKYRERYNN